MAQINLLMWREQAKQAQKNRFNAIALGFVLLAMISILALHIYYGRLLAIQLERNDYLQLQLGNEQTQLNTLLTEEKEFLSVEDVLHFIMGLKAQNYLSVNLLDALSRAVPGDITINKLIKAENIITIQAKSKSDASISVFMDNLNNIKQLQQPQLNIITTKQDTSGDDILFEIKVIQRD